MRYAIFLFTFCPLSVAAFAQTLDQTKPVSSSALPGNSSPVAFRSRLPITFEPNVGQASNEVRFLSRGTGYTLYLTADGAVLAPRVTAPVSKETSRSGNTASSTSGSPSLGGSSVQDASVVIRLASNNPHAEIEGRDELAGKVNYFIGNDPKKWRSNIPTYGKVEYQNVYPGVDLIYYSNVSGQLEFDFMVAPGADPNAIRFKVERGAASGATKSGVVYKARGELLLRTSSGELLFRRPEIYQPEASGEKRHITGSYVETSKSPDGTSELTFEVGQYDHSKPLIIDPTIMYSTYLGGTTNGVYQAGIATYTDPVTGHAYAYVAGASCASDFPTSNGVQMIYGGNCDAFVTKFDPSASGPASVIYSTYLGGSAADGASGIAADTAGNAYITGSTNSGDFPMLNAYQGKTGQGDAFLVELGAQGSAILYSTYFGGSGSTDVTNPTAIALDPLGHAYITGTMNAGDLPFVNPFTTFFTGPSPVTAFVSGFDTTKSGTASLIYSTYLVQGAAYAIAVDAQGYIHVGGYIEIENRIPGFIANGFQTTLPQEGPPLTALSSGGFYAKLNPRAAGAAQLMYATYLGGGGHPSNVAVQSIAVDSTGNAYLAGIGDSTVPLTPGVFDTTVQGEGMFVAKINPSLSGSASLIYSTFTGGQDGPGRVAGGIAVDSFGDAFVTGNALPGINLVNPVQNSANGVFQSINAGQTWRALTQGIDIPISALVVDKSTSPRTLYAGTPSGKVFTSADGGQRWALVLQSTDPNNDARHICQTEGLPSGQPGCVTALAIDPTTPSHVFAGTSGGVYESLDRGSTWTLFNSGLSSVAVEGVTALAFDGGTLYAGAGDGMYVLSPGATSWTQMTLSADVWSIAIDTTTTPHTFYTGSFATWIGYTSSDGGNSWTLLDGGLTGGYGGLYVDQGNSPATIYDTVYCGGLYKSNDRGHTWTSLPDPAECDLEEFMVIDDSTNPATIYHADGRVTKSVDGGNTWTIVGDNADQITLDTTIANSTTPAALYIGSARPVPNVFVEELNPSGTGLLFSTYLGGGQGTGSFGTAIALDNSGNIYLTGSLLEEGAPLQFLTVNAFQPSDPLTIGNGLNGYDGYHVGFFTALGTPTLPSSGSASTQVAVQSGKLSVSFANITGSTTTSTPTIAVTPLSSTMTANFQLSNNLGAYDISTTATYTGNITLCVETQSVNDQSTFNNLELLHVVNGTPVNVTTSWNFPTRTICGTVTSLSPFVLVKGVVSQIDDLLRNVNEVDLRRGILASLDAKLQNAQGAYSSAIGQNYDSVCNMMGAFINNVQAQSGKALTTTEAAKMIAAAEQIQSTLGCVP